MHVRVCVCVCVCAMLSHKAMSDSVQPHGLCSPTGSSVQGDSPGKNTAVGCHALLQGIFPTQGSNPGLPHYRRVFYGLNHQGSPYVYIYSLSIFFPLQVDRRY